MVQLFFEDQMKKKHLASTANSNHSSLTKGMPKSARNHHSLGTLHESLESTMPSTSRSSPEYLDL